MLVDREGVGNCGINEELSDNKERNVRHTNDPSEVYTIVGMETALSKHTFASTN